MHSVHRMHVTIQDQFMPKPVLCIKQRLSALRIDLVNVSEEHPRESQRIHTAVMFESSCSDTEGLVPIKWSKKNIVQKLHGAISS